jgi:hypothetical protein
MQKCAVFVDESEIKLGEHAANCTVIEQLPMRAVLGRCRLSNAVAAD